MWLTATDLAKLACISDRKSRQALAAASRGALWRGVALRARLIRGRGGRSGLSYEVLAESLPLDLQERLKEPPDAGAVAPHDDRSAEIEWFYRVFAKALIHPDGSRERSAAIAEILAAPLTDWNGRPWRASLRTIQRKLAAARRDGTRAVLRCPRSDRGKARVVISSAWAASVDIDELSQEKIAGELRDYIRGLWKADASYKVVEALASNKLRELTVAASGGVAPISVAAFAVPRRFISAERRFRNVAIFKKDRKAYEDARPRVLRTREGLSPTNVIVGDVHHLDIVMRRADGSEAWPKAIAWLDMATNRIWLDAVLLGPGEGIRNADVIASFIRMVREWGVPRHLYLDNGAEYNFAEFVSDALKLVSRIECLDRERASPIIRARPYNAPAKAIEGIFRVLSYTYFRTLPGWAGGDRMNKKTATVGKPTEPFPGTIAELRTAISHCLSLYELSQQSGTLKGRSPRQSYAAAIEAGWQRIDIDTRELHTVFASDELRRPRQGYISFGGDKWTCRELHAFLGDSVIVRAPKFEEASMLPLLEPTSRKIIGYASRATYYGVLDPAGARAASDMARTHRAAILELDQAAPDVNANEEIARVGGAAAPSVSAPIIARIGVSEEAAEIARGLAEAPDARDGRHRRKADRTHRKQIETTQKFLRLTKEA